MLSQACFTDATKARIEFIDAQGKSLGAFTAPCTPIARPGSKNIAEKGAKPIWVNDPTKPDMLGIGIGSVSEDGMFTRTLAIDGDGVSVKAEVKLLAPAAPRAATLTAEQRADAIRARIAAMTAARPSA